MKPHSLRSSSWRRAQGFTLLEAIVAMVVFSLGAFALYGWLSTNMITLGRVRDIQNIESQTYSALDLVRRTNPMQTPQGQRRIGDLNITWTSRLLEPVKAGSSQSGAPTIFEVGLYELQVKIQPTGQNPHTVYVRQVGWRQTYSGEL